ncbi:MAG: TlyA family RNA methyltransferase [Clostridia bacterium]|nr:TlyA family RNA methyltransferase [Clostridia bacterium]
MDCKGERLDAYLVAIGAAGGREKAKEIIEASFVTVNGVTVTKASRRIAPTDKVVCAAPAQKYVGRGGYKLERAIEAAGLRLTDAVAMDVGASTGGFTDCMLQNGAARVYAVDVGHDQLHPTLRSDPRVVALEGTDVRSATLAAAVAAESIAFCSVDVSFVSLSHVLPAILPYLAADAVLVCLIKPQFEAGKAAVGKRGVVKDRKVHVRVLAEQLCLFASHNLAPLWLGHSPITGGEGNIEYLAVLRRGVEAPVWDPAAIAQTAFEQLK